MEAPSHRKLPHCAKCGKSMKYQDYVLVCRLGVLGQPSFGWHVDCEPDIHPRGIKMLAELMRRKHPWRVISAGVAWWKAQGYVSSQKKVS